MAKKRSTKKKTTRKKTTTRRAATTKKTTRKKATTRKKTAAAAPSFKVSKAEKARTKSQIFTEISDLTELSRKEVASVFDAMGAIMKKDLSKAGVGTFTVPGLMKVVKTHKPRRAARKGINPFTGEMTTFKAKAAHNVVKVRALKGLKEMV